MSSLIVRTYDAVAVQLKTLCPLVPHCDMLQHPDFYLKVVGLVKEMYEIV